MNYTYRKVKLNEADDVFRFLKESAEWLRDKGIDYWQDWHNPNEVYKKWILEGIENGEFNFALDDTDIVGMYRLQEEDEMFWGKRGDVAGYIHSFTTRRKNAGKGIGRAIMEDIEEMLLEKGTDYVRLDCGSKVMGLCRYYESCGFKAVGEINLFEEMLTLYEKKIGDDCL